MSSEKQLLAALGRSAARVPTYIYSTRGRRCPLLRGTGVLLGPAYFRLRPNSGMAAYPNTNQRALRIIPKASRLIEFKKCCAAMGRLLCPQGAIYVRQSYS